MAISRAGGLVGALSGRVGGVVFRSQRVGQVVAVAPRVVDVRSAAQLEARSQRALVVAGWRGLGDDVRQAWRTFAAARPLTNRLGVSRAISGWQAYASYVGVVFAGEPPAGVEPPRRMDMIMPGSVVGAWFPGGPLGLTVQGPPWPGEGVEECVYVQRMAAVGATAAHRRIVRVGSFSKVWSGADVAGVGPDLAASVVDGERVLVGARWWIEEGLPGPTFWAPVVVGAAPVVIDDFESGEIGSYAGNMGNFSAAGEPVHDGDYSLRGYVVPGVPASGAITSSSGLNYYPVRGHVVTFWWRHQALDGEGRMYFGAVDEVNCYRVRVRPTDGLTRIERLILGAGDVFAYCYAGVLASDTWYRVVTDWGPGDSMRVSVYSAAGVLLGSGSGSDGTYSGGGVGWGILASTAAGAECWFDSLAVTGRAV